MTSDLLVDRYVVNIYELVRRHIQENLTLHQRCCNNLVSDRYKTPPESVRFEVRTAPLPLGCNDV